MHIYFASSKERKETKEPQKCHFFPCSPFGPSLRSKHVRGVRLRVSPLLSWGVPELIFLGNHQHRQATEFS